MIMLSIPWYSRPSHVHVFLSFMVADESEVVPQSRVSEYGPYGEGIVVIAVAFVET
jgi:hypothetical protein